MENVLCWRKSGDWYHAVHLYPSRASDAGGRTDFLEKQLLAWKRPPEVPAALAAFLLLSKVATWTDALWWDRRSELTWEDPEVCLEIAAADLPQIPVTAPELAALVEHGIATLCKAVSRERLGRLYDQLKEGHRPAFLTGLRQPLPPEALAALLLPLPREQADALSLAGWLPAGRASLSDLAERWDVLALSDEAAEGLEPGQVKEWVKPHGSALAEALWRGDPRPARSRGEERPPTASVQLPPLEPLIAPRPLQSPPHGASPLLQELYAFARANDRRWLDPAGLRRLAPIRPSEDQARDLLPGWIAALRTSRPPTADPEQWAVKLDLLRGAAITLYPTEDTVLAVGSFESRRLPPLFFAAFLDPVRREELGKLSKKRLSELLEQSLHSQSALWNGWMRLELAKWRPRNPRLSALLREALSR